MKPNYLWSLYKNNPWGRLYFFLLLLTPIPVLVLPITIFYRLPCITKATEEIRHSHQIKYEIERDKIDTSDKKMEIAVNEWESVRSKIPGSYEAVSYLIIDLNKLLSSRGFEMSYTLGELMPYLNGETVLSLLPLNLTLKARKIDTNQNESVPLGLPQFVELLQGLVKSYYGLELSNVVVKGVGEGIGIMDVSINLWVSFGVELHSINDV